MRWEAGIGRGAHCTLGVPPVPKGAVVDAGLDRRHPGGNGDEVPFPNGPSRVLPGLLQARIRSYSSPQAILCVCSPGDDRQQQAFRIQRVVVGTMRE